jgi:hypothetical protein
VALDWQSERLNFAVAFGNDWWTVYERVG